MNKGILIIGHGSRALEAQQTFESIIDKLKAKGYQNIEGAHMELAKPNIREAVEKLDKQKVDMIVVVPLFIYSGIHIKEDIPQILEEIGRDYPHITIKMGSALGDDDLLVSLLEKRVKEMIT
ncbi:CbiX/SirB N-terminal domain-containing protein [Petroclostridium sp. X23]|jgi:sirohydrochlorin cobaltochelatase|nr:CbiX/SirB N-terminal domain-containing protein [Petroclostridium sp. X23]WHH57314.1 CbiX/SirB N-terminal domain-containing protein [Petroclostridium sp. X23]